MKDTFVKPVFGEGKIEFRFEGDEICIYASKSGLEELSKLCNFLREHPQKSHVHLEDYNILTPKSLKGTIAVFED